MDMEEILILEAFNDTDHSDDDDDIGEAVVLHIFNNEENLGPRNAVYGRFNLDNIPDLECKNRFRFYRNDIVRLARALGIPDRITTNERISVSGIEALCILLRRLAYPNRLVDLEPLFGLSSAAISSVFNYMLNIISNNTGHLLENLIYVPHLNYEKLVQYSQAIVRKGSPIQNCWGFIDGTARPICRPSVNQENYYSGHKKTHCLKYQSVICPDGIIISLKGAYEGRRHDAGIFRESGLYEELLENTVFPNQNQYFVLYGDQAYGLRELLLRPYSENEIRGHPERQDFNNAMGVLRVSVEWGFNKILQEFPFLDFKKNQKILLQEVEKMYKLGMILTNCHTCLYGSETSNYFEINPPALEDYLG